MRLALLTLLASGLFAGAAVGAAQAPGGSLLIDDSRGIVEISGSGVLVGRMERGSLKIIDLTPVDQWSPRVYGIPRGKVVTLRGKNVSFYVPGGRYKIVARGVGVSISARGTGIVRLIGVPDPVGATGTYAVGDDEPEAIPDKATNLRFGPGRGRAQSAPSVKIRP